MNHDQLAAFLADVANVAHESRSALDSLNRTGEAVKKLRADASAEVEKVKREASGFAAPRFVGMGKVAKTYGQLFNDPDAEGASDAANKAALTFLSTFTGVTEKSIPGGRKSGVAALIRCGAMGPVIIDRLQRRLAHWYDVLDSADSGEGSAEEKAAKKAMAREYTQLADSPKEGAKPKWAGRQETTIGDITISGGKGTNRDAQVAQAANYFLVHGEKFLADDVLDAFLHNGGRTQKEEEKVGDRARRLGHEIAAMLNECGDSPDRVQLTIAMEVMDRIAERGEYLASQSAKHIQTSRLNVPAPEDDAPDADTVLSGGTNLEDSEAPKAKKRGGMSL